MQFNIYKSNEESNHLSESLWFALLLMRYGLAYKVVAVFYA